MMTGQQALRAIEQAAAEVRSQENAIDTALRSADEAVLRLRADRSGLFRQLAQVRLDALQKEKIVAQLDLAERQALQLVADDRQRLDALSQRLADAAKGVQAAEAERHAALAKVTEALEALEHLQASVEPKVRGSAEWLAQKTAVNRAAAVAEAADAKAKATEADREAKRLPYESDPLFTYLWKRKFGTSEYRSGFLVRFFDRKIANLVGYPDARTNYTMLNEIPARLRQHAEDVKAALDAEKAKLVEIERAGLNDAGSTPLEQALADARIALGAAEQRLAKTQAELKSCDAERQSALVDDSSSTYRRAIDLMAQADEQQDIRQLTMEAAQTMTGEDDALVRQIAQLNFALTSAEKEMGELRRKAQVIAQQRAEVEQQRDQFRRQGYDNPMGQFSNDQIIGQVLGGIIQGAVQGAVLGNVLKGGYSQRPPRADSGFGGGGGFTLPDFGGGGGGGGGFSGGGDGFRTGGGF
jgi:chromosome segregation ATPase